MLSLTPVPSRTPVQSAREMLVKVDFCAKIVALVATKNAALLPAAQIIYVCNVKTWTYPLLTQATGLIYPSPTSVTLMIDQVVALISPLM